MTAAASVAPVDVAALETIAAWKEDLQSRIRRAQLCFELVDVDFDFAQLSDEVEAFKRTCRALTWRAPEC